MILCRAVLYSGTHVTILTYMEKLKETTPFFWASLCGGAVFVGCCSIFITKTEKREKLKFSAFQKRGRRNNAVQAQTYDKLAVS